MMDNELKSDSGTTVVVVVVVVVVGRRMVDVGVVGVVWLLAVGVTGVVVARLRRPCRKVGRVVVVGSDQEPGAAGPSAPQVGVCRRPRCPRVNAPEALACVHEPSFSDSAWRETLGWRCSSYTQWSEKLAPWFEVHTHGFLAVETPCVSFFTISKQHAQRRSRGCPARLNPHVE